MGHRGNDAVGIDRFAGRLQPEEKPALKPSDALGRPGRGRLERAAPHKAATWLILPVVICLSQRLSHACLSINCFIL